ncbi:MAG: tetratricopeptide repeat protein [Gemmatimonadetes bacterium]|nr:tetratricopeptide repeat protein [Gemmatimonadota bacterium]MDA1102692.1 tetratricopeptide repeat protein [Gemmatimonadota bacterium]
MPEGFLSSEEYDEQAHKLYNDGDYDGALEMLKEGLALYPNAVELYVGLGYARLAREEFAWARHAFESAVVLDPGHEDALVGLGEALLRFGERAEAMRLFDQVASMGFDDDIELMLTMGRALYRAAMYGECRDIFAKAAAGRPDSAEAAASLGYALHRLGDEVGAGRQIRRALRLDADLHEARIYLGHLLYDRGDWEGALRELERVPPLEHWDALAVWRLMELKRTLWHLESGDPRLAPWEQRLRELEDLDDPIDRLLAEVESRMGSGDPRHYYDPSQLELFERAQSAGSDESHIVRLHDGHQFRGSWYELVRQMRDHAGFGHETLSQYMRRLAERWHEQSGVEIPSTDPESFLKGAVEAGLIRLEVEE